MISLLCALSVLGCVVNGPGEARETDIGITGGGNGKHMVYLSGLTDHHVQDADCFFLGRVRTCVACRGDRDVGLRAASGRRGQGLRRFAGNGAVLVEYPGIDAQCFFRLSRVRDVARPKIVGCALDW